MTPFIDDWKIWFFSRFRETKLTMKIRYFLWCWREIGFGAFSRSYFGKKYFKLIQWSKISLENGAHQLQTDNDACLSWTNFIEHISYVGVMGNAQIEKLECQVRIPIEFVTYVQIFLEKGWNHLFSFQ